MLRISRLTDYGILLLTHFARGSSQGVHNARDLAAETEIPLPTVSKLLKSMTKAGLLVSHRGVQGGYSLAKAPSAITVEEVITALEGPIALTMCSEGPGNCELEHDCLTRSNLQLVNQAIKGALDGIRLSDLTTPPSRLIQLGTRTGGEVR
ncbi:MAG: SUF system Fe-S cluster assembly regulator [Methanobacteriota archaeon]